MALLLRRWVADGIPPPRKWVAGRIFPRDPKNATHWVADGIRPPQKWVRCSAPRNPRTPGGRRSKLGSHPVCCPEKSGNLTSTTNSAKISTHHPQHFTKLHNHPKNPKTISKPPHKHPTHHSTPRKPPKPHPTPQNPTKNHQK